MMKNTISRYGFILASVIVCFSFFACNNEPNQIPRVLVFSKTEGFHHESIPTGVAAIQKLGAENGFVVDTTTNAAYFIDDSLKRYSAVVFMNTTEDVLNHYQEAAFERYIQAGGGYVGVHAAADTEYQWGWYGRLVGGYFESHPEIQEAVLQVVNQDHPSTEHLPEQWKRADEWYNYKNLSEDVNVLINLDEATYKGGKNGNPHPIAWYHEYDGGRAFYTGLGHTEESFSDPLYLQHLLGGIVYAIGDKKALDYSKAVTRNVPEEDRFIKKTLTQGTFYEPMEMAILPNLDVLVIERRGGIKLYKNETGEVKDAGSLDVYATSNSGANIEEGLLGLAADPDFENNRYVYMFYSPADTSVNRLSRFTFRNDAIDPESEKVVLQFYSQRSICCHTGGSIAFGPDGLLYLSTGDNSTPFDEPYQPYVNHGYAPLDDRPGHEQYDARRSSSNTDDLRGKIIRIKVNPDASYEIPEGNLFVDENPQTRPEIYTMGHRNPYRISVDQKNGNLYWGEIGPDARADSLETRGPRGYDEFNQAREAGYFGWPLFIGDNYPYHRYNYRTGESGPVFDPENPINDSPNNTGIVELPPAQPAFLWYPYAKSEIFPQLGTGGRSAMAGPVYYTDLYPKETRYPEYYNGKLFLYEWVRNWIRVVSMKANGDFDKMEPFMEGSNFVAPVDMEIGPDGKIYVLEYGQGWFSKNPDAGLARIDYVSGNLPPKIIRLSVDKEDGNLPLTVTANLEVKDPEGDRIQYVWNFGNTQKVTREPRASHTFVRPGDYVVSVTVRDRNGAASESEEIEIIAGNEQPKVNIVVQGNQSFYFPGRPVSYQVQVSDTGEPVENENLLVSADYIQGKDLAGADLGHQVISEELMGKNLMQASDCKACHKIEEKSIGPAFVEVAAAYPRNRNRIQYLTEKIIQGGGGVWGENVMPAHPDMKEDEAEKIAKWVLSLANSENRKESLPAQGVLNPSPEKAKADHTVLKLSATYTDRGNEGGRPLSGSDVVFLRNTLMDISDLTAHEGFVEMDTLGREFLAFPQGEGWINAGQLDLQGMKSLQFQLIRRGSGQAKYEVEVRKGAIDGEVLSNTVVDFMAAEEITVPLRPTDGEIEPLFIRVKPMESPGAKVLLQGLKFNPDVQG